MSDEQKRSKWREEQRVRRADPVSGDKLRKSEQERYQRRVAGDPEYKARKKAQAKAKGERDKERDPKLRQKRHQKMVESMTPEQFAEFKEKRRIYANKYYHRKKKEKPETYQRYVLMQSCRVMGITIEDYEELMEMQEGVCAICGGKCSSKGRLAIDHDHATNEVRGLLCDQCNNGLGRFNDNPTLLDNAIKYLAFPPNQSRKRRRLRLVS